MSFARSTEVLSAKGGAPMINRTRRIVEGVEWRPYSIRFTTQDGKRHTWTHWSPGPPWLAGEVNRYLSERGDIDVGKPGAVVIKRKGW